MRYALGLLLAITILGLFGVGESEAACRAAGEYRVTGPTIGGVITLRETSFDASSSSGTVDMEVASKFRSAVGLTPVFTFKGDYRIAPNWDGSCFVSLRTFNGSNMAGGVGGTLAFGGAVIFFEGYDFGPGLNIQGVDLNLTLGIRSDSLLRP